MGAQFEFDFAAAKAAVLFIAGQGLPDLTKGKICKLMFLADRHHLVRHARPIIGDSYCAMGHGPVPSRLLDLLNKAEAGLEDTAEGRGLGKALSLDRHFQYPHISAAEKPDMDCLPESAIDSLKEVIAHFGNMTFTELRAITHETPAYAAAWESRAAGCKQVPMNYEDFFYEEEDAIVGVKEEMIENAKLRAVFPEPLLDEFHLIV